MTTDSKSSEQKPTLNCPTCNKKMVWDTNNPYRPFCSERCKLIDFGAWANEEHKIPGKLSDISEKDLDLLMDELPPTSLQ